MRSLGDPLRSASLGCVLLVLLLVLPSREAEGVKPPFVCTHRDAGSERIHVEFDGGSCSTTVGCYFEGCRSFGECETRTTDAGFETTDSMGSAFFDCGETLSPCGRDVRCACPNAPKTRH